MAQPTFFFSHARRDSDQPGQYLLRFFRDLEERIAAFAVVGNPPYGVIDRRIKHGSDWDSALSAALDRNNAFLAVLTPLYGMRPNCGKELGVFLLRSPTLGINAAGQLTGLQNILPIQWMPREAYTVNAEKDALIPPVLRRVEDVPADPLDELELSKAIKRYRRYGMERCVSPGALYYRILLDLIAKRIVDLPELPPANGSSFATAIDAFKEDWPAHFGKAKQLQPVPTPGMLVSAPQPLESLVVFHVTDRAHEPAVSQSDFSAQLIADPDVEVTSLTERGFAELLSDIRCAAAEERMTTFHAVSPVARLQSDLEKLQVRRVPVAVVVDSSSADGGEALDEILGAQKLRGAVLRTGRSGPNWKHGEVLPDDRGERRQLMRRVFVALRGEALRSGDNRSIDAERVPMLQPPHGTRT